jgi:hypothetical protein
MMGFVQVSICKVNGISSLNGLNRCVNGPYDLVDGSH